MIWGLLESKGRVLRLLEKALESKTRTLQSWTDSIRSLSSSTFILKSCTPVILRTWIIASFIRNYSNSIGRLWWFVQFVFRAFIVTIVGSQGTGSEPVVHVFSPDRSAPNTVTPSDRETMLLTHSLILTWTEPFCKFLVMNRENFNVILLSQVARTFVSIDSRLFRIYVYGHFRNTF